MGELVFIGTSLIHETIEKVEIIRKMILADKNSRKSYASMKNAWVIFEVRDQVMLKV